MEIYLEMSFVEEFDAYLNPVLVTKFYCIKIEIWNPLFR